MSARPARFPTRPAANDGKRDVSAPFYFAIGLLAGLFLHALMSTSWARIMEWVGEFV